MTTNSNRHYRTLFVLAAALLLRATIPAGYMPAGSNSGLFYELCPDGLPAAFVQTLQHEHAGHHADPHEGHALDHDCSFGHLLLPMAAVDSGWDTETAPTAAVFEALPTRVFRGTTRTHYHSRGPPA